ncbi:hypothetical protein AVEN_38398-1 [Araneus ventricosus]|uniref:Uncharacterized protein n=1 Tax=Araneus ventricosus TaxID=182803 RepID=A0A4Y2HC56_ARAVE|nr:hypothetical protein AVEN_38398-1 [Araneus ventricosus]
MTRTAAELAPPLQTSAPHQSFAPTCYQALLSYRQEEKTWTGLPQVDESKKGDDADLQWNQISNLEPSGSEAEALPLDLRGGKRDTIGICVSV